MPNAKPSKTAGAIGLLSNQPFQWALGLFLLYLVLRFALPDLFGKLKQGFSDGVDSLLGNLADIVGRPKSQDLSKRTPTDEVKGLLVAQEGDRSLSDLVDSPGTFFGKLIGIK